MKQYYIVIDKIKIGSTNLDIADIPMGIIFGKLNFEGIQSGYDFFLKYCTENKIEITHYKEDKLILTSYIPNLSVINENGKQISGIGCCISGMDNNDFEITIEGIPYPLFEKEFPHHVALYKTQFKDVSTTKEKIKPTKKSFYGISRNLFKTGSNYFFSLLT